MLLRGGGSLAAGGLLTARSGYIAYRAIVAQPSAVAGAPTCLKDVGQFVELAWPSKRQRTMLVTEA
jgi:hypothetical protein